MSKRIVPLAIIILGLLAWGCESPEDEDGEEAIEEVTPSINTEPFYFSFTTGALVENLYDIRLIYEESTYKVALNAVAAVSAVVRTSGDFATARHEGQDLFNYDSTSSLVIGNNWMDVSTYNEPDNHSIEDNGTFYFVRTTTYSLAAFMVKKGSTIEMNISYAYPMNADSTFPAATTTTQSYSEDVPVYLDLKQGTAVEPADWHMGLVTIPVFDPGTEATYYMPAVLINYGNGTQAGVITDKSFGEVTSVPADISWLVETADTRPLGYGGDHEVLVYHPEPPYNHKVLVEHPEYVYIVETDSDNYYKLRFTDYDSGIVLFEYAAL